MNYDTEKRLRARIAELEKRVKELTLVIESALKRVEKIRWQMMQNK